jgi:hypothetical protein
MKSILASAVLISALAGGAAFAGTTAQKPATHKATHTSHVQNVKPSAKQMSNSSKKKTSGTQTVTNHAANKKN